MAGFVDDLIAMRDGDVARICAEQWDKVIRGVILHQKQGKFQLTLTVQPAGAGKLKISAEPKIVEPKEEPGDTLFFVTPQGQLSRNDPKQMEMFNERMKERNA